MKNLAVRLQTILAPDQMQTLRESLQQNSALRPAAMKPVVQSPVEHKTIVAPTTRPVHPAVGDTAPNFHLTSLSGQAISLADYKGKTLVIEFGSLTSAVFRDHVKQIESLAHDEPSIAFLIIYTREAHPKDGWEIQRTMSMIDQRVCSNRCSPFAKRNERDANAVRRNHS